MKVSGPCFSLGVDCVRQRCRAVRCAGMRGEGKGLRRWSGEPRKFEARRLRRRIYRTKYIRIFRGLAAASFELFLLASAFST